jgi:uncharacterized protein (TIGR04255 family)
MANWKNAPLIYTLGMIQFPRVPDIGRFTDRFLDSLRNEYPLPDEVSMPLITAHVGAQGIEISQQDSKLWQFCSVDKRWGFILNEQSLCLHTVQYHDFADFAARFKTGISALLSVPDIGISWTTAIGIRYVDMIVPKSDQGLSGYLKPWLLPTEPPDAPMTIAEGAYVARYKTEIGELRLQALRDPPFTLPPELQSPFIVKNGWAKARPEGEFALVDTDHGITFSQPEAINVDKMISQLDALHVLSKRVFESMGTPEAVLIWKGEK